MMNIAEKDHALRVAILGDGIDSRGASDPVVATAEVRSRIQNVNELLRDELLVGFSLSQGDEIQALAGSLADAWKIVDAFDSLGNESRFRFTLGVGEVAGAFADRTWDMDGTCFHHARDAMAIAKQERRWVAVHGLGDDEDLIVNGMIRSLQVVREDWTRRQREAVLIRRESLRQQEAAARLGIHQATLSKMLKAAHYGAYMEADDALQRLMHRLWGGLRS